MVKKLNIFLFSIVLLLSINLIYAQIETLGTFKQNSCVPVKQSCSNCTSNNITSINIDGTNPVQVLGQVPMNKSGYEYNYTFCSTGTLGKYIVMGVGDIDGNNKVWAYDFQVTPTGDSDNLGLYIMLSIIIIGLTLVGIFIRNIPLTIIGSLCCMAWGVYVGINGFDIFRNTATQVLAILIIAFGGFWGAKAGLESLEVI